MAQIDVNSLQVAYDISSAPHVVLSAGVGGMIWRDNAAPLGATLWQLQDSASAPVVAMTATQLGIGIAPTAARLHIKSDGSGTASGVALESSSTTDVIAVLHESTAQAGALLLFNGAAALGVQLDGRTSVSDYTRARFRVGTNAQAGAQFLVFGNFAEPTGHFFNQLATGSLSTPMVLIERVNVVTGVPSALEAGLLINDNSGNFPFYITNDLAEDILEVSPGGNLTLGEGQFLGIDADATLPSYAFASATDRGLFVSGTGIGFAVGGVEQWTLDASGNWVDPTAANLVDGVDVSALGASVTAHLADVANPHVVTLTQAYVAGPTVALNDAQGTFQVDASARGIAGDEVNIFDSMDGATSALRVGYDRTALRTVLSTGTLFGADFESNLLPDRAIVSLELDRLRFLRQDRAFASSPGAGFFTWDSTLDINAAGASIGGFVSLDGRVNYNFNASAFGMGNALRAGITWAGVGGANLGPGFVFAGNNVFLGDGGATTINQTRIFFDNAAFSTANAGTITMAAGLGHNTIWSSLIVNAGASIDLRRGLFFANANVTAGTLTTQIALDVPNLTAATNNIGIRSGMLSGNFIEHNGIAPVLLGGPLSLGLGATVDWSISRVAANLASLAAGDSLRITGTGFLFLGDAGSVALFEGAANRLDLATGDDFRLISGQIEFAGTAETISRSAGELLLTAPVVRASAELEIDGTLDHDGTLVGFYGTAPTAQSAAYTPTNVTPDRAYDANAPTLNELADVLGTLIADLQLTGIIA